ncbi:MAG: FAD-dependent oxidoreductase [Sporomusaceae bacterium]|nr:FAD-dependent oxidoreductase [Sporomusaceae bacterium]
MKKYDVVVIGTGAANIVLDAALKQGLKCAQIEKGKFGGTCLTRGCIPTKVMVTAADYIREIQELPKIGVNVAPATMNWELVSKRVWQKINESDELRSYYESIEELDVYRGIGHFTGEKNLQVTLPDGALSEEFTADKIILAVGARTKIPTIEGLEATGYLTSETFFGEKYPAQPFKDLIIIGGGPIGTEFAHVFAAAGTKVTVVQQNVRLLPREDSEISAHLLQGLRKAGITVLVNHKPLQVEQGEDKKILRLLDKTNNQTIEIAAQEIMLSTGIESNADTLQLEHTAVEMNDRGWIVTNEFLETSAVGIWALGDVNGEAPFRHKANYEADILAHNLFGDHHPSDWRWARYDIVPAVTYTFPQVAHVGITEAEALKQGYEITTAKHHYSATAKGFALGFNPGDAEDGFVKVIVEKETKNILGIHIVGPQSSILLQPFVNLMNAGETRLTPVHDHIASPTTENLRRSRLVRNLDPRSIVSVGETMTPHPSLSEVIMWIQYYFPD